MIAILMNDYLTSNCIEIDLPYFLEINNNNICLKPGYKFRNNQQKIGFYNFSECSFITLSEFEDKSKDNDNDEDLDTYVTIRNIPLSIFNSNIFELNFKHCSMGDKEFHELTKFFLESMTTSTAKSTPNFKLLLNFNNLSAKCAPDIITFIKLGCNLINLTGNPNCSGIKVANLLERLKDIDNEWSTKCALIFLPEYYVYQAKTFVPFYRELNSHGLLPDNWAEQHYDNSWNKNTFKNDPDMLVHYEPRH